MLLVGEERRGEERRGEDKHRNDVGREMPTFVRETKFTRAGWFS
jgi:hypothetical protein